MTASYKAQAYLGDGVYVEFDGYETRIYTSNGKEITNVIVLDPHVYTALTEFMSANLDSELTEAQV